MKNNFFILTLTVLSAAGQGCGQEQDEPAYLERIDDAADFERISVEKGDSPRFTRYLTPAKETVDGAKPLPTLFQNVNRYPDHIVFLSLVFPDRFPDFDENKYMDLVLLRETRSYFAGVLMSIDDPIAGSFYGFTIYVAAPSAEVLEVEEVRAIHATLSSVFRAGELYYTFEQDDYQSQAKAHTWENPGFPIYFYK